MRCYYGNNFFHIIFQWIPEQPTTGRSIVATSPRFLRAKRRTMKRPRSAVRRDGFCLTFDPKANPFAIPDDRYVLQQREREAATRREQEELDRQKPLMERNCPHLPSLRAQTAAADRRARRMLPNPGRLRRSDGSISIEKHCTTSLTRSGMPSWPS
jgi:hypothetical protein